MEKRENLKGEIEKEGSKKGRRKKSEGAKEIEF
jgi:hypothetical protein